MKRLVVFVTAGLVLAGGVAVAATYVFSKSDLQRAVREVPGPFAPKLNERISAGALGTAYTRNPKFAPQPLRGRLQAAAASRGQAPAPAAASPSTPSATFDATLRPTRFNLEKEGPAKQRGFPQNEESLAVCPSDQSYVLGGANDYRGFFLDPKYNGGGWYFSNTGGDSVAKEGFLPELYDSHGNLLPSSGDPAMAAVNVGGVCTFYVANINFFESSSAAVYKTTVPVLNGSCKGADCWPTRRLAAPSYTDYSKFVDKEWLAADSSRVVVTYTLFDDYGVTSRIEAVLCNTGLSSCSNPIEVDSVSSDTDWNQGSYVSISPTGKIYVTWNRYHAVDTTESGYEVVIKGRVCQPTGLTCSWGPVRTIATDSWVPWGAGTLVDTGAIREATMAKSAVSGNRWWVVWDRCATEPDAFWNCPDGDVALAYSDNDGASWTRLASNPATGPGHQFMSTQPSVRSDGSILIGYLNTADARAQESNTFDSRLDTYVMSNLSKTSTSFVGQKISELAENPLADWWWLSFYFWGDYFSTATGPKEGLVSFTGVHVAQRLSVPELHVTTVPIHQQDNFIARFAYP